MKAMDEDILQVLVTEEQLKAAGVPVGLVRISCGLEHKDDLIADIKQALEAMN